MKSEEVISKNSAHLRVRNFLERITGILLAAFACFAGRGAAPRSAMPRRRGAIGARALASELADALRLIFEPFEFVEPVSGSGKEKTIHEGWFFFFWSGLRGSNPPPPPWQGGALPNELNPQMVPPVGIEPTTRGFSVLCSTN